MSNKCWRRRRYRFWAMYVCLATASVATVLVVTESVATESDAVLGLVLGGIQVPQDNCCCTCRPTL